MDTRDEYSHLPPLQQRIVRFLASRDDQDGVHLGVIARGIKQDNETLGAQEFRFVTPRLGLYDTDDRILLNPVLRWMPSWTGAIYFTPLMRVILPFLARSTLLYNAG